MNTAEAMAQIQTVMSAAEEPVACVLLEAGGKMREVIADHRQLGKVLGGSPTIVGALRLLDVTAVATTRGAATKHELPKSFDIGVRGDILLVRNAEDSSPMPLTLKEYRSWLKEGGLAAENKAWEEAAEEEGGDDEEGEEFGEESDDEDDGEEGSESEGEEGTDVESEGEEEDEEAINESVLAELEQLPMEKLREFLTALGLDAAGSREELIARVQEKMAAPPSDASEEEDEDEEEEEEEEAAPEPEPTATKRAAGKSPVTSAPAKRHKGRAAGSSR